MTAAWYEYHAAMRGIPPALETDTEDVTWALQTAEALWKRNERADALVWLRRAAQAAGEAEHDDRALELAHDAAELAEWIGGQPDRRSSQPSKADENEVDETEVDEVEEVSVEVPLDSASSPREPMDTPTEPNELEASSEMQSRSPRERVPSAAEKHAGMLDPWAESEVRAQVRGIKAQTKRPSVAAQAPDADEVVTSAPPIERRARVVASRPTPPAGTARARQLASGIDLADVDALSDLPDDARDSFARAAVVQNVSSGEEISGFALALVLEGSVDVAATIVDASAQTLQVGAVVRSRGTVDQVWPLRLVAASDGARIATWDEAAVEDAFRTCPWVEDDLRAAGDRIQALAGVTMGPLGERFDPMLRAQVASKLTLRVLAEHEIFATRGEPIPGLLIVGAGELELIGDERTPDSTPATVKAGDFLFPNEVLLAGSAPSTVRSGKGGALVLFADRHLAQELLVTCPPLLEIFAGM